MEKFPEKTIKDYSYGLFKAALTAIPYIGSPAAEIITTFISSPFDKRKDKWCEMIANEIELRLSKIENHTEFILQLQNNEEFISTLASATQVAMQTHFQEKITALKNLTFNTLNIKDAIELIKIRTFIFYIERFEPEHLFVLKFFSQFNEFQKRYKEDKDKPNVTTVHYGLSATDLWNYFNKEFKANSELMEIIINGLYEYGLITQNNITVIDNNCMTKTGKDFIKYIDEYEL